MKYIIFILTMILKTNTHLFASCSSVPHAIKDNYASAMLEAFVSQSFGKSTVALYQFDVAREKAKKAGENPLKLLAIEKLFIWYRMYASSLNLYHQRPTGHDQIFGEYRPSYRPYSFKNVFYGSEWGNSPEQSKIIRNFMFGVGEVIAGVFCATVSSGSLATFGAGTLAFDGVTRIYSSLNDLWAYHQTEMVSLKQWETNVLKPAVSQ